MGFDNVVFFVCEKCYDFFIWIIVLWIIFFVFVGFWIGYVVREMFEYESLNESIFVWCECVKFVVLGFKIDWISI